MNIIRLRDHTHNLCRSAQRISGARERLGLYRCDHGITAALARTEPDGTALAIDGTFATEDEARIALAVADPDRP